MWVVFTKHSSERGEQRQFTDDQIMEVLNYGQRGSGTYKRDVIYKFRYRGIVVLVREKPQILVVITAYRDKNNRQAA